MGLRLGDLDVASQRCVTACWKELLWRKLCPQATWRLPCWRSYFWCPRRLYFHLGSGADVTFLSFSRGHEVSATWYCRGLNDEGPTPDMAIVSCTICLRYGRRCTYTSKLHWQNAQTNEACAIHAGRALVSDVSVANHLSRIHIKQTSRTYERHSTS